MHSKKKLIKNIINNPVLKLVFLLFLLVFIFGQIAKNGLFVRASDEKIDIYAQEFFKESNFSSFAEIFANPQNTEFLWQKGANVFSSENGAGDDFSQFNEESSAVLILGNYQTQASSSEEEEEGGGSGSEEEGQEEEEEEPASEEEEPQEQEEEEENQEEESEGEERLVEEEIEEEPVSEEEEPQEEEETLEEEPAQEEEPVEEEPQEEPAPEESASQENGVGEGETAYFINNFKTFFSDNLYAARDGLKGLFKNFASLKFVRAQGEASSTDDSMASTSEEEQTEEEEPEEEPTEEEEIGVLKDSLIFSSFSFDESLVTSEIINAQLRISLAAQGNFSADKLLIEYATEDDWIQAGNLIISENTSNFSNGGYFLYAFPIFSAWENISNLKIRLSYVNKLDDPDIGERWAIIYLDSLWLEVDYSPEEKETGQEEEKDEELEISEEETEKLFFREDILRLEDEVIDFVYTDNNENETLIIKTDKRDYYGLKGAEVYFSITNTGREEENFGLQIYFPEYEGDVEKIEKLTRIFSNEEVPRYGTMSFYCEEGWVKKGTSSDIYLCQEAQEEVSCATLADNNRRCNQENTKIGTVVKKETRDLWKKIEILDKPLSDKRNIFEKMFKIGPKKKEVPESFRAKKSTLEEGYSILPGETQFFKMKINFPFDSLGEFYIETVGEKGYGLLDPWWNASWDYEREIDITYSGDALSDFQIKLEVDTATLISGGKMQSDCDDIRFLDSDKGENDELYYFLEPETCNRATTTIWIKVPSITGNKTIYMYYGNTSATAGTDGKNTFVWFNNFETSVGFNEGNLNPSRSTLSDRYGTYGIEANASSNYRQEWRNGMFPGRNLIWETWIREDSNSASTSLAGITVGHPDTGGENYDGYQAIINTQNPYLEIREDYVASPLCSDNSPAISDDTWYFLQFRWESDGDLTASLYRDATTSSALLTCNTNDTTHTDGEYGVGAYQEADWDNYRIRKYATSTVTVADGTETAITNHVPTDPSGLIQYKIGTSTILENGDWTEYSQVNFYATSTDKDADPIIFYYQLVGNDDTFITTTTKPTSTTCSTNTNYNDCASKIWSNAPNYDSSASWYDNSWLFRRKITIDADEVFSTESNFAVLVATTSSHLANNAREDGYDIIFTDSSGTTTLQFERELYASSTGQMVYWVKMDISSTTDTDVYIYYGNSSQSSDLGTTTGIWDSNYIGVWHMNQDPSGSILDSTVNGNNMVSAGGMGSSDLVNGQIGKCLDFDGAGDYITTTSPSGYTASQQNWTVSAWFMDSIQSGWSNFYAHVTAGPTSFDPQWAIEPDTLVVVDGGSGYYGDNVAQDDEWHRVDFIRTGTNIAFYIDGVAAGTAGSYFDLLPVPISINIGNAGSGETEYWLGELDEIRYSETNRSLTWIKTEYSNQNSPSGFMSFSDTEGRPADVVINVTGIPDYATGYKWQVLACDTNSECSFWTKFNTSIPNFKVDTGAPTTPGDLTEDISLTTSVIINFGSASVDGNFDQYKIFYKAGSSGVDEGDALFGSSSDSNLASSTYGGAATTTISGLNSGTQYVFNIWAYDSLGNKASATNELVISTKYQPSNPASLEQYKSNGSTAIANEGWTNEDQVKLYGSSSDGSGSTMALYYELIANGSSFTTNATVPTNACFSGTAYNSCGSNIWVNGNSSSWYDFDWKYRRKITIDADQVLSTESNFPVLITTSSDSHLASNARTDAHDVMFTDSTGTTTLQFEREYYSSSTGEMHYWVKTNISSTTDTDIYMYYGNSGQSTDLSTTTGVWDSNYVMIHHLEEDSGTVTDSTGNYDGSYEGTAGNQNYDGPIDGADDFNGSSNYIDLGTGCMISGNTWTFEGWVNNGDLTDGYNRLFIQGSTACPGRQIMVVFRTSNDALNVTASGDPENATAAILEDTWYHFVWARNNGINTLYLNGQPSSSATTSIGLGMAGENNIGYRDGSTNYWNGPMDEIRLSNSVRSATWIETEYNNQNSPSTFFSFFTREDRIDLLADSQVNITAIDDSATGYKWQVIACNDDNTCSSWVKFNATTPNFKVDTQAPTAPGNLTIISTTTTSVELGFGATTTEINFDEYRIYYKVGTGAVSPSDILFGPDNDADLDDILYNDTATTSIETLTAGTTYTIAIFAYDFAGNIASSATSSFSTGAADSPPTGIFNSVAQKIDGSGGIDVSVEADDIDNEDTLRAKLEYVAGASCDFSSPLDTTLDETLANISSDYGDPRINNNNAYQVGYTNYWIWTSPGSNTVNFDWLSKDEIDNATGTYCLRLTVNDSVNDQTIPATTTVYVDNADPSQPGNLGEGAKTAYSVILSFGSQSSDDNFKEYKIFYKAGSSGVTEGDSIHSSSTDANLASVDYNSATSTTISGLNSGVQYVFNIWAYDDYGNKASATQELVVTTRYAPIGPGNLNQYRSNGTTTIPNQGWTNENQVILSATSTDSDESGDLDFYFNLATTSGVFATSTDPPTSYCASTTTYVLCSSKIWHEQVASTSGAYSASVNPTSVPNSATGYKWQVMACDTENNCSSWVAFNATTPNFKVDTIAPTAPGWLIEYETMATSATVSLGTTTTEDNFSQYKIFYKEGASGVTESDSLHGSSTDANLASSTYGGASTTQILNFTVGTQYVLNIWAYDQAGNKASATQELVITTEMTDTPPTGIINSAAQKVNGSGVVDLSITADDADNNDTLKAKIEFVSGGTCDFTTPLDPTLDETPANVSATHGTVVVDNDETYQVGSSTGWIQTSPGANTVNFDWDTKDNIPNANGTYCIRLTVNDGNDNDQLTPDTQILIVDNTSPSTPGDLSFVSKNTTSITIQMGTESTDDRFDEYKVYYKAGSSGVTEGDTEHVDASFDEQGDNTTISGLSASTQYVFNIFAYDTLGNKASATTELVVTTASLPSNPTSTAQYKANGTTAIPNQGWTDENEVNLYATSTDLDGANVTLYYELIASSSSFTTATTVPSGACSSGTSFGSCTDKIWTNLSENWYDSKWPFRKKITIDADQVASTESNFPVLIATTTNSHVAANAREDAYDIIFTDSSGTTTLQFEREYYSSLTGEMYYWVKTNISSTTDTDIYMYYGNTSQSTDLATTTGVWDSNYVMVHHLQESSGTHYDSTPDGPDGTYNGAGQDYSGPIDGANDFDGSVDYVSLGTGCLVTDSWTFETWFNADYPESYDRLFIQGANACPSRQIMVYWLGATYNNGINAMSTTSGANTITDISSGQLDPDIWYHFVWTSDSSTDTIYLNGLASSSALAAESMGVLGDNYMGTRLATGNWWDGFLDEVRLSNSIRSATWIETEYNNQNSPSTFLTFSNQEGQTSSDIQINIISFDNGSYKWQAFGCTSNGCSSWVPHNVSTPNFSVDTVAPTAPGPLSLASRGIDFIKLTFGTSTTEVNFKEYRIYYKQGTSSVSESDSLHSSSTDSDLAYIDYNSTTDTTISGLESNTDYVFNIWAYDHAGNKASSTEVTFKTVFRITNEYNYTAGTSPSGWVNPDNAWDLTNDTYAYRDTPASGADDSANYLLGNVNDVATTSKSVVLVELGIEGYVIDDDVDLKIIPIFGGTATGSTYTIDGSLLGTSDDDTADYINITEDGAAPADWSWDNAINLDVKVYAYNASSSVVRVYVDQIKIRVTVDYYPNNPGGLEQYLSDATTTIANGAWVTEDTVVLYATTTDPDTTEILTMYFEYIPTSQAFATSTDEPSSSCSSGTAYGSCSSKIWSVPYTGEAADFSTVSFEATTTITSIPEGNYKWQALACDDDNVCSVDWTVFNATTPNMKVDADPPTGLGTLSIGSKTSIAVILAFGSQASDLNFDEYRIYYKEGSSGVDEGDTPHSSTTDVNLASISYGGATSTIITGLTPNTQYVFNIWAYDQVGHKASSTEISTTTSQVHSLTQTSYLIENDDGVNVNLNTTEVAVGTSLTQVEKGQRINIRFQVQNDGGDQTYNKQYKIQFENNTDSPGDWPDVGVSTEISRSAGFSGSNGDAINSSKAANNSNDWYNGTWHENINTTNNYNLAKDGYTEFVFAVRTIEATVGKTYRFRLIDATASSTFAVYDNYPTIVMIDEETKKYSKNRVVSLPSNSNDLTFFFDAEGYEDVATDDGNRDEVTGTASHMVYNFVAKHSGVNQAVDIIWNGQSNVAASTNNILLQVYRFGSTNAWVTMGTNSTSTANTDFTFSTTLGHHMSEHYNSGYIYWRIYQESGNQTLRTDYVNISTSSLTTNVGLKHYRWRDDDALDATWREVEDAGDPTTGSYLDKGDNVRLRLYVSNTSGATSTNYVYQMEYATTSADCSNGVNSTWFAVPATSSSGEHFEMSSSTYFSDGDDTSAQLANSEGYTYATGTLVEKSSPTTSPITLVEDYYTEIEYVFRATNDADDGGTYCFRLTNDGSVLDYYDRYAKLTLSGVANNAPIFSVLPSDGGSATSTPTNDGDNVNFSATGNDLEGDNYYLAICKTANVTPGDGDAPTCNDGNWCISAKASSTDQTTCSYTTDLPSSETEDWHAYLCDHRVGMDVAQCSSVSQGQAGMSTSSPFKINHAPVFDNIYTSVDNQDPGGTFVFQATTTDNDSNGGSDSIYLYVCRTNSASFSGCSGGAGNTICSVSATTTPNPICDFTDTAPTPASSTTYYAFVYDNHQLQATTSPRSSNYTINNVATQLGTIVLNSGSNITLNIRGAPDKVISVVSTSTTDQNGCQSLVSATAVVFLSSASSTYNCSSDNNDCYQISTGNCVKSACDGEDDSIATYTCTTSLKYYAIPTDNTTSNPWEEDNWLSRIRVYDGAEYTAATSAAVEIMTSEALEITEEEISFGAIAAGSDTGSVNQSVNVINSGNCPLDNDLSGSDMSGPGDTITVDNIEWSLVSGFSWGAGIDFSTTATTVDLILPKATSSTDIIDLIYWGIGVPGGKLSVDYIGTSTFSAALDDSDWPTP